MPQIFHRSTNAISRVSIFGAVFFVGGALWLGAELNRSPYVTRRDIAREQPVPVQPQAPRRRRLGIDCRYCHTSVESSRLRRHPADRRPA